MSDTRAPNDGFRALVQAIVGGDTDAVSRLLASSPDLARTRAAHGATRQAAEPNFLTEIGHYLYAGDTALHIAAAAYRKNLVQDLVALGADVRARNRRGAEPLHYAADGMPASRHWDPSAQVETIACLLDAGADPNSVDKSGVMPLHRAIRNRCAAAVRALLDGGAHVNGANGRGSTPFDLATRNTGRGGSGSPEAKAEQAEILNLLKERGATPS
jgi:ankyrin repeat protein